jgi:hypothetical protein
MSRYLVQRIERHGRISVRTHTQVTEAAVKTGSRP